MGETANIGVPRQWAGPAPGTGRYDFNKYPGRRLEGSIIPLLSHRDYNLDISLNDHLKQTVRCAKVAKFYITSTKNELVVVGGNFSHTVVQVPALDLTYCTIHLF